MLPYPNMLLFSQQKGKYLPVHTTDESLPLESDSTFSKLTTRIKSKKSWIWIFFAMCIVVVIFLAIGTLIYLQRHNRIVSSTLETCKDPKLRQEWRTMSMEQQHDYIKAALCLRYTPSRLHSEMSLYEDFPFLHDVIGDYGT